MRQDAKKERKRWKKYSIWIKKGKIYIGLFLNLKVIAEFFFKKKKGKDFLISQYYIFQWSQRNYISPNSPHPNYTLLDWCWKSHWEFFIPNSTKDTSPSIQLLMVPWEQRLGARMQVHSAAHIQGGCCTPPSSALSTEHSKGGYWPWTP